MNYIGRLILLLVVSCVYTVPLAAAVNTDLAGYCDLAGSDDKKDDGKDTDGKKDEEEPECE